MIITFSCDSTLKTKLDHLAKSRAQSLSSLVRYLCIVGLDEAKTSTRRSSKPKHSDEPEDDDYESTTPPDAREYDPFTDIQEVINMVENRKRKSKNN